VDLSNYWQENKRFLTSVGVGVAVFTAAWFAIDNYLGADLRSQTARKTKLEADLKQAMFTTVELEGAKSDNAALVEACNTLRARVEFVARPEFRLEKGVPATSRYFTVLERTRDDLRTRAGRAGLAIPDDLGMPAVAPTKEVELGRYLEALDAIEQAIAIAIDTDVQRVEALRVKLDPRLLSGKPFDDLEKTAIEVKLIGSPVPLTKWLASLASERDGRVLLVEKASVESAHAKHDEIRVEATLLVVHTNHVGAPANEEATPPKKTTDRAKKP
jgi:hypothetical protein